MNGVIPRSILPLDHFDSFDAPRFQLDAATGVCKKQQLQYHDVGYEGAVVKSLIPTPLSPFKKAKMASTSSSTTIPSWFPSTPAPVYGIILAATTGTRLFPLTSSSGALSAGSSFLPKHLLPVAGIPCLARLLDRLCMMSVQNIVLTISSEDTATVPTLLGQPNQEFVQIDNKDGESKSSKDGTSNKKWTLVRKKNLSGKDSQPLKQTITIMALSKEVECFGSIDAWKQIELAKIIPESSHVVILPGDLVLSSLEEDTKSGTVGQSSSLFGLDSMFRRPTTVTKSLQPSPACTMVLVDVGEQDENGIPLKESAKVSLLYVVTVLYKLYDNSQSRSSDIAATGEERRFGT